MQIEGSIVLVTGSGARVGKSIALRLAEKGACVVVHYHTQKAAAKKVVERINAMGTKALLIQGDVSRMDDWQRMSREVLDAFGRIDVLVNCAAIFYRTPFLQATPEQWDEFMAVNLKSVFMGCRVFGEIMVGQRQGKIINIADVAGEKIWPNYLPYCVSKAGVIALTRGLAKALAPHVTVNAIAPGTVLLAKDHDPKEEQALIDKTPLKRIGNPQDIANSVAFLIEGSDFINGAILNVDGGRSLT